MTKLFPFSRFVVHGNSMLPILKPGQDILCFNWAYLFSNPKKGDMVVIVKNGKEMVKRIQNTQDGKYFVKGDNEKESIDSRSFGTIDKDQILGKVIFV